MKPYSYILFFVLMMSECRPKTEPPLPPFPGKPEVPSSIKKEHESLLGQVHQITLFPDSTGLNAKKLEELMLHHFMEEENYVLPPLGLLPSLSNGQLPEQTNNILLLTEKLKSQMTHLSVEHQMIKAYMDELKQAAAKDNHPEVIEFEKELHKHANIEEEVLFPSAILIGEYLKLTRIK